MKFDRHYEIGGPPPTSSQIFAGLFRCPRLIFTRHTLKNKATLVSFLKHEQKLNPRGESVLGSLI